ncbi:hemin uptake protein HemP [Accumulibacter sp.]|uniref:hemin uptake protein HemP n=1 Tax=Accumulibacter sp. TaxID=2053492 RepID=UPI0028C3767F|nr:hemin uptake protein HemP [Accumulibacter sp.]
MTFSRSGGPPRLPLAAGKPVQSAAVASIDSRQLFQQSSTIHIEHAGQRYVLRVTRENKLILTK